MGRFARAVEPGIPYHITQRGNLGDPVFLDDDDRESYLHYLFRYTRRFGMHIWAYCLMLNHIHLIAVADRIESFGKAIGTAHMMYCRRINDRLERRGHLWQSRFFSAPMDERHSWAAVRYVEQNPVRAGLVVRAEEYAWSSARAHCGGPVHALLDRNRPFPGSIRDWSSWLAESVDPELVETVVRSTATGRPCGSEDFVRDLEKKLGRVLAPQKPGPRPKSP